MPKKSEKISLFNRAMNLADKFFDGIEKFKKLGEEAGKQNIEILDQMNPGFKESHEKSMKKIAEVGSKLEEKSEKILFGKDMYWGAGGAERKAEVQRRITLDSQIKSASNRVESSVSSVSNNKIENSVNKQDKINDLSK